MRRVLIAAGVGLAALLALVAVLESPVAGIAAAAAVVSLIVLYLVRANTRRWHGSNGTSAGAGVLMSGVNEGARGRSSGAWRRLAWPRDRRQFAQHRS